MAGNGIGWWFMIIAAGLAVIPFVTTQQKRWWPGAWGWSITFISIGILVSDNFRNWATIGISGVALGAILGFAGVMNGPNSPA